MASLSEKIRTAPNAAAVNRMLPDEAALIRAGRKPLWTLQVNGAAKSFPEDFDSARNRAAEWAALGV